MGRETETEGDSEACREMCRWMHGLKEGGRDIERRER